MLATCVLVLLCARVGGRNVQAQSRSADELPSFDVVSIKPSPDRRPPALRYVPNGVDFGSVPLTWVIGEAYQVPYGRISGRDADVRELALDGSHVYDIIARAGQPVPKAQIRLMLRTLLATRFKMSLRSEAKVESVYKLVVARRGAKLTTSTADNDLPTITGAPSGFDFRNFEMARFAGFLSTYMDHPVVDRTDLTGRYDFALTFDGAPPPDKSAFAGWMSSSIVGAIEPELGLKLDSDKASVEYLVVNHVEKPTDN